MASLSDITIKLELRPCYVKGKKALFHNFYTQERVIFKNELFMKSENREKKYQELVRSITEDRVPIIDNFVTPYKVRETAALVEYEDGTMELVQPELVRFIDTQEHMDGIAWPEPEEG